MTPFGLGSRYLNWNIASAALLVDIPVSIFWASSLLYRHDKTIEHARSNYKHEILSIRIITTKQQRLHLT